MQVCACNAYLIYKAYNASKLNFLVIGQEVLLMSDNKR